MLFSSIPFLFWFFPCVLIFYFMAPRTLKNFVLLLSSLFFYGWGEPKYLVWMVSAIVMGYVFGLLIEYFRNKNKIAKFLLVLSVSSSLAILGYFKYYDFFIGNFNAMTGLSVPLLKMTLPIGISFYTFQILSYTIDVYRKDVAAQKNPVNLAVYVALFPQLIAGPIVRYSHIANQLKERSHSFEKIALGIRRFIIGLGKKIMIANLLGSFAVFFVNPMINLYFFSGSMLWHIRSTFILIFPATAIWLLVLAEFSGSASLKTSIIRTFLPALLNFGSVGIYR